MLQWAMGISIAGLAGIWARVGLLVWLTPLVGTLHWLPVGIINLLGCLGIGCVLGGFSIVKTPQHWEALKVAMTLGFLGGFTTFSSFAWDAFTLWQQWRNTPTQDVFIQLLMTLFLQPLLGLAGVAIGYWACRLLLVR